MPSKSFSSIVGLLLASSWSLSLISNTPSCHALNGSYISSLSGIPPPKYIPPPPRDRGVPAKTSSPPPPPTTTTYTPSPPIESAPATATPYTPPPPEPPFFHAPVPYYKTYTPPPTSSTDTYTPPTTTSTDTYTPPPPPEPLPKTFFHAPISYFDKQNLTSKGPRKNADIGTPHDATRPLAEVRSISSGSWWCSAGGWPSYTPRTTTEVFFVFSGFGKLTDMDGVEHSFGPGDTVILPKGWAGRWDVLQDIHKVWFVNDHPNVEEIEDPIRAKIVKYETMISSYVKPHSISPELRAASASNEDYPSSIASRILYDVGPNTVDIWTSTPGVFAIDELKKTCCFHLVEGVVKLTNNFDRSSQRCVAGDTVVLPKGWAGEWSVLESVRKLRVVV